jgi:hypothetical protein
VKLAVSSAQSGAYSGRTLNFAAMKIIAVSLREVPGRAVPPSASKSIGRPEKYLEESPSRPTVAERQLDSVRT